MGSCPVPNKALPAAMLLFTLLGQQATAGPRVIASIAPLHSLVAAVMAGGGEPQLLLRGGESPHTFSLRPSGARMLHDADLLFWIGPSLELPLARILPSLDAAQTVAMLETPGLKLLPTVRTQAMPALTQGAAPDHDHAGKEGGIDPHIWLSPANAALMADRIAQALAQIDPSRSGLYRSNALQLRERLAKLDRELREQLAGARGSYVVFHDAYRYLEHHYGLRPVGVVTTHPERTPGAGHLRALRAVLVDRQVRCLFSEPQFEPRLVAMLGNGLAIRHAILDPLGADISPGPDAYLNMMRVLAETMVNCMQENGAP